MLVAVLGVTPKLAKRGTNFLHALLVHFYGSCSITSARTVDDIKTLWPWDDPGVIYFEEPPHLPAIEFLLKNNIRTVALVSTFSAASLELLLEGRLPPLDAARATSRWFSAIAETVAAGNGLIVHTESGTQELKQVLSKIACFLGLSASSEAARRPPPQKQINALSDAFSAGTLEEATAGLAKRLLSELKGYDQLLECRPNYCVHWPNSTFHLTDKDATLATDYIELTGPARLLVFGPYMGLPRGRWIAAPAITVADNLSGNNITIDISTNLGTEVLAKVKAKLPAEGEYWCEIAFEMPHSHLPIEVRLFLNQGAIEGKLRFNSVTLRRQ
jgi:hypothetical protein